jgi:diguanylate cyclase (GGDEF)-like protein
MTEKSRVLVVDDDAAVARVVRINLATEGYEIQVASSGVAALDLVSAQRPDCILLDVMMPQMDGLEVCRRLKANPETDGIAIIMLTARAELDDKLAAFRLGADDYLTKPFDVYELSARVKAVLSRVTYARIAAQNGRLLQESQRRQTELETLQRLATQVARMHDLEMVLQFVADGARDLIHTDAAVLRIWTAGQLLVRAHSPDRLPPVPAGEPDLAAAVAGDHMARAALGAEGILVRDLDQATAGWRALSVPVVGAEPLGALTVWCNQPRPFQPREAELLDALATQAAIAVENTILLERTRRLATTDPLTGVANHRELLNRLDASLEAACANQLPLAVLMVDVDRFKEINDTFGHPTGDDVLRAVASLLTTTVRPTDLVARYGGDEFLVVLPHATADEAYLTAQRLVHTVGQRNPVPALQQVNVSISVGLATFPEDATTRRALIQAADQAMYFAKHEGGCRVYRIDTSIRMYERDPARLHALVERANLATIETLAAAIEARDPYTRGHIERVGQCAVAIAADLGVPAEQWEILRLAARLHDIGKIGISDAILKKPGPLTPEEYEAIKAHSRIGHDMLRSVPFLQTQLPIILHHHEHLDGSGYPSGLHGEAIPLAARILLVADALDAMTSDRVYRKALPLEEAVRRLRRASGKQFDARIVEAALRCIGRGTIVLEATGGLRAAS